jgi:salicylate hydroxylase
MWVLCDREPIKNWSAGSATLVGDAAHPMLQYLAQGACMALDDAVVLAEAVKQADGDLETALQAYQEARYLRTGKCEILARMYGEFYHATSVARELRNAMLSGRSQEASYEGLAWHYDF